MTYYQKLKDKIQNKSNKELDGRTFNAAMSALKKNTGVREEVILNDIESIEIEAHEYPANEYYLVANVYNSIGDGFQFVVKHETKDMYKRRPGEITN